MYNLLQLSTLTLEGNPYRCLSLFEIESGLQLKISRGGAKTHNIGGINSWIPVNYCLIKGCVRVGSQHRVFWNEIIPQVCLDHLPRGQELRTPGLQGEKATCVTLFHID